MTNIGSNAPKLSSSKVLARSAVDTASGRALSDADSGSEWETEDEDANSRHMDNLDEHQPEKDEKEDDLQKEDIDKTPPEPPKVVVEHSTPLSYSSILKSVNTGAKSKTSDRTQSDESLKKDSNQRTKVVAKEAEVKKIKKRDPIVFDLAQIVQVRS
jgi:hypothetical protein